MTIAQQLTHILQTIQTLQPNAQLIAVTKNVDATEMNTLYQLGQRHFAENRYEQLLNKQQYLPQSDIIWHYIGRTQTRQVKHFINAIDYFHALDRLELAKEINKRATHPIACFVQVNVSGETQKGGIPSNELQTFITALSDYPNIHVVGLMMMAPFGADEDSLQQDFEQLANLRDTIQAQHLSHAPCNELSMGMSDDYPIALKAGATFIRVGSALFQ